MADFLLTGVIFAWIGGFFLSYPQCSYLATLWHRPAQRCEMATGMKVEALRLGHWQGRKDLSVYNVFLVYSRSFDNAPFFDASAIELAGKRAAS